MSALAIDIGSYTIKAVAGKPGKNPKIIRVAEKFNNLGLVIPTEDAQVEQLAELLDDFIKDEKLPVGDVRLSLPESVISTKVIEVPRLSDAELASAIGWQAEQYIPIPPEELALEFEVLYRPDKSEKEKPMRVLLVGARKPIIQRYVSVFGLLGLEPTVMETHILSVVRSLEFTQDDPTTLVAHLGATSMSMGMVHKGELAFVFNHMSGGQLLTKSLEQNLSLSATQAEEYKRAYGLDPTQFQGKVAQALQSPVRVLTDEMLKAIRFFVNKSPTETVQRVLLSGGTAQLIGLVEKVTDALGVEVLTAAPFATAEGAIPETNHPALTVCMGLLMRGS